MPRLRVFQKPGRVGWLVGCFERGLWRLSLKKACVCVSTKRSCRSSSKSAQILFLLTKLIAFCVLCVNLVLNLLYFLISFSLNIFAKTFLSLLISVPGLTRSHAPISRVLFSRELVHFDEISCRSRQSKERNSRFHPESLPSLSAIHPFKFRDQN